MPFAARLLAPLLAALALGGCATTNGGNSADPWENLNRNFFVLFSQAHRPIQPFLRKQHGSEPPFCGDRDRDLVEMNHRIANSLQLAANYLKLQAKELADDSRARLALGASGALVECTIRGPARLYGRGLVPHSHRYPGIS